MTNIKCHAKIVTCDNGQAVLKQSVVNSVPHIHPQLPTREIKYSLFKVCGPGCKE